MILSDGPTSSAGLSIFWPFTLTRPSRIMRSASRREATPLRAMTLAIRSVAAAGMSLSRGVATGPGSASVGVDGEGGFWSLMRNLLRIAAVVGEAADIGVAAGGGKDSFGSWTSPPMARDKRAMAEFRSHMALALAQARAAARRGEVPVGAVIVDPDGRVVAQAGNRTRELCDPTAHAEVLAIRAACAALGSERLVGHDLWVTLEPCPICAGTISAARIARLYYGASDARMGGVAHGARVFDHPQCHHRPQVYDGLSSAPARALLQQFFQARRPPPE